VVVLAITAGVCGGTWLRTGTFYLTEAIAIFVFAYVLYRLALAVLWRRGGGMKPEP
jgi:hypothetical protein